MNQAEREAFVERLRPIRRSYEAWDAFCRDLEPGPEMDACIEYVVLGSEVFIKWADETFPDYSHSYNDILPLAIDENDYISLMDCKDQDGKRDGWKCALEFGRYHGDGAGRMVPEAVCRAMLDLYAPTAEELAGEED